MLQTVPGIGRISLLSVLLFLFLYFVLFRTFLAALDILLNLLLVGSLLLFLGVGLWLFVFFITHRS